MPSETKRQRMSPEDRREQILQAARVSFAERPYSEVSLSDIAREAGVSRSLLNHYFEGKLELLVELMRRYVHDGPEAVRTDLELPIQEMMATNVDAWLTFVEENRPTSLAYIDGPLAPPPQLRELTEELRDGMVDRIATNHYGSPDIPPSVRLALRAYTGMFEVVCYDWLVAGDMSREQVRALLTTALMGIVRDVVPALEDPSSVFPAGT